MTLQFLMRQLTSKTHYTWSTTTKQNTACMTIRSKVRNIITSCTAGLLETSLMGSIGFFLYNELFFSFQLSRSGKSAKDGNSKYTWLALTKKSFNYWSLAHKNSQYSLASLWNDVWGTSAKIRPYWWHVTTQKICFSQSEAPHRSG